MCVWEARCLCARGCVCEGPRVSVRRHMCGGAACVGGGCVCVEGLLQVGAMCVWEGLGVSVCGGLGA